jgi:ribosomal protein L11 methyltransferase
LDRKWWAVTLTPGTGTVLVESLADWLYAEGAAGVEWDDGQPVTATWADDEPPGVAPFVRAYFPDDEQWPGRRRRLRQRATRSGTGIQIAATREVDWETAWRQYYHAIRPGRRIWVVPAWEAPPDPGAPVIRIDPGMAFGTGTHPTTAMMLTLAEDYVKPGSRWIDVGTGSGILALAAWLLGAETAAVEPDPVAIAVARDNFALHGAAIPLYAGTLATVRDLAPADGIMANLTARILEQELDNLLRVSRPGALWLLSGILSEHAPGLEAALHRDGRVVRDRRRSGGWEAWAVGPA